MTAPIKSQITLKLVEMAGRKGGVSNAEAAHATGLTSEAAGTKLAANVKSGRLFKAKRLGEWSRYFATQEAADSYLGDAAAAPAASPAPSASDALAAQSTLIVDMEQLQRARAAVTLLSKEGMQSNWQLGARLNCLPSAIDNALEHLVQTQKLIRVTVMRDGYKMFDYRMDATYVPCDADFVAPASEAAPAPVLSPTPAPKPARQQSTPAAPSQNVSPWGKFGSLKLRPETLVGEATTKPLRMRELTGSRPPAVVLDEAEHAAAPTAPFPKLLPEFEGEVAAFAPGTFEAAPPEPSQEPMNVLVETDLVCAINSRGEFVLDLGDSSVVKLAPSQALLLKRFLDNTSVLEELAGKGEIE